jgi:hypothetical protein
MNQPEVANRPRRGAALFRWIIEQRKTEKKTPLTAEQQAALDELRNRNAQRGTPVVEL